MWSIISKITKVTVVDFIKNIVGIELNEERSTDFAFSLDFRKNRIWFSDFISKTTRGKK